jgi:hypothetical protein
LLHLLKLWQVHMQQDSRLAIPACACCCCCVGALPASAAASPATTSCLACTSACRRPARDILLLLLPVLQLLMQDECVSRGQHVC